MKLKHSLSALKLSPLVKVIFPVLALASAALRFLQVKTVMDPSTGFYTQSSPLTWAVNILMLGGACLMILWCYLSEQTESLQTMPYKSTPVFAATLVFSLVLLARAALCFADFSKAVSGYGLRSAKELMSTGALPLLFQSVFALLSAVYFIFVAVSYLKGTSLAAKHRLLALAPTAWIAARMLHLFVRKISFMKVSDLFFELMACMCMILFFLAFAQVTSGVYSTGMAWRLVGFGLPAALLTIGVQLPRLVLTFLENGRFLNENHRFIGTDLCFGIVVFGLSLLLLHAPKVPQSEKTAVKAQPSPLDDISPVSFGND